MFYYKDLILYYSKINHITWNSSQVFAIIFSPYLQKTLVFALICVTIAPYKNLQSNIVNPAVIFLKKK